MNEDSGNMCVIDSQVLLASSLKEVKRQVT